MPTSPRSSAASITPPSAAGLSCYDFGRALLRAHDLDPVYEILWAAHLDPAFLRRYLLSYFCFYHVGTASWCCDLLAEGKDRDQYYWERMAEAAGSKEWPRCQERRHFRGAFATRSVAWLKARGVAALWAPFDDLSGPVSAQYVMDHVSSWYGFGPWIAFKAADVLDRLGLLPVTFDLDTAMYDSPMKGVQLLWAEEGQADLYDPGYAADWAVRRVLEELAGETAPPRHERPLGLPEVETIFCKHHAYRIGRYHVGEDVESCRKGLSWRRGRVSRRLYAAGGKAGLWR
jgi:hypothetical protein